MALYVPDAAPGGIVREIGLAFKVDGSISTKPAAIAAASNAIRYSLGVPVVEV